jgi:AraC-like DNA-binding protein
VIETETMLRLVFGAAGASAYFVLALVVLRAEGARGVRAALFAVSILSAVGLMMDSPFGQAVHRTAPKLDLLLRILAAGVPGGLWFALTALFRDRRLLWTHALPALVPAAAAAPAYLLRGGPALASFWIWVGASTALLVHAIVVVVKTRQDDLVESRRRLRLWMAGICVLGCAVLLLFLITIAANVIHLPVARWWPTTLRALMAATALAAVTIILDPRRQLLPSERKPSQSAVPNDELIRELDVAMVREELWRQEGLTLAAMAARLRTPEYKLRSVVNTQLGHRNFTEFVNGFRVEAAKALLIDRSLVSNVAQVAYTVGFSSLAPFNRAFKEITGLTPTQWRREMLIEN